MKRQVSNKYRLLVIGLIVLGISIIAIFAIMLRAVITTNEKIDESIEKEVFETKYSFDKKVEELRLYSTNDYVVYLNEIVQKLKPKQLQDLVKIDRNYASVYEDAFATKSKTGSEILKSLYDDAYYNLLNKVVKRGNDWSNLPLTKKFREKFKSEESAIVDISYDKYVGAKNKLLQYDYTNKKFSLLYVDEKEIEYDRWYSFILDSEGYLDDIIFIEEDYSRSKGYMSID